MFLVWGNGKGLKVSVRMTGLERLLRTICQLPTLRPSEETPVPALCLTVSLLSQAVKDQGLP